MFAVALVTLITVQPSIHPHPFNHPSNAGFSRPPPITRASVYIFAFCPSGGLKVNAKVIPKTGSRCGSIGPQCQLNY